MSIYKRGGVWWLYVTDPNTGQRVRRSTGEGLRPRAQRIHDEFKAELWKQRQSGPTLHGALDAWAKGRTGPDVDRVNKIKRLIEDGPAELDEAQAKKIPHKTVGTLNRYLNLLSAAGVKFPPKTRKKPSKGRLRWLTAGEWKDLYNALPEHWRPMAAFAVATGVRQANVFWLEWGQVDLARRKAWIHADEAKAGEAIGIPLSDAAMAVLEQQHGKSAVWVFPMPNGNPLPKLKVRDWKAAVVRAGIAYCTWHDLRHTWATWHLMGGTPLEVLKTLGGWKDLRMVMRYAHLAESHVDRYAENAKPYAPQNAPQSALTA